MLARVEPLRTSDGIFCNRPGGIPVKTKSRRFPLACFCWLLFAAAMVTSLPAQQSEIERYSRQAEQAMAAKDWPEATKALEKLAELAPGVAEVQGNLGMAYYSQNRILEAAGAFRRALKINPQMEQANLLLGICWAELGRNQDAVSILEPAFQHAPNVEMARLIGLDLQRAYAGLKQYAKAAAISDQLVERYPKDPEILFQASRLHADRAYQMMRQLIQADANSVWVHYATAEVQESLEHYDLAAAEYRVALQLQPRLPGVHFRLGRAILQGSKEQRAVEDALREFQQKLTVAPENPDAEYEIGEIWRQRAEFEKALEHFSKAATYQPDFEEAHIGTARTLISLGRPREAMTHLQQAIRLNSRNDVPHFLLASVYKSLGDTAHGNHEMVLFQKLHAAENQGRRLPGPGGAPEVTQQELDPGARQQR